jgi:cell division transport system permease protein
VRAFDYAMRQGWASLWRARMAASFAVIAIALAIVVLGALLLVTWNAQRLVEEWSSTAEFSIYLQDGATSEQRGAIEALLDESGATAGRDYVSKVEALSRFRRDFTDLATLADAMSDNPFPASLEVRVRPEAEQDGRAAAVVQRVIALPGVADVRYDREWLSRLSSAVRTISTAGLAVAVLMAFAAAVTVASVVRLGLHGRRDEIEIMELVGAPMAYIRGPFVAEGFLQGGAGALLALLGLWVLFVAARLWWATDIAGLLAGARLEFLPLRLCVLLVLGGTMVGSLGGLAASRHAG